MKYQVDKNQIDSYIHNIDKRRIAVFAILTLVILSMQAWIAYSLNNTFPFWLVIIITVIVLSAIYLGLRLANDKLKKLSNGQYFIDNTSLKFEDAEGLIREFNFTEIAIIHKKYSGTLVVKDSGLTKLNYFFPKRTNPYQPGEPNIIFIPAITSNYADLIKTIKQAAPNAIQL